MHPIPYCFLSEKKTTSEEILGRKYSNTLILSQYILFDSFYYVNKFI